MLVITVIHAPSGNSLSTASITKEFKCSPSPIIRETLIVLLCSNGKFNTFSLITINDIHVVDFPAHSLNCRVSIDVL